jgi:hypothetical protein
VRLARQAPVAHRWAEGNGAVVFLDMPLCGVERRHDLVSAAAAAQVSCRPISTREVKDAGFEPFRDVLDEFWTDFFCSCHRELSRTISSVAIALPA